MKKSRGGEGSVAVFFMVSSPGQRGSRRYIEKNIKGENGRYWQ
jgi:hypothetical protein